MMNIAAELKMNTYGLSPASTFSTPSNIKGNSTIGQAPAGQNVTASAVPHKAYSSAASSVGSRPVPNRKAK